MQDIITRMKRQPIVFDGAMGTMIYERGVFINTCYDELCLTRPDLISEIHHAYLAAGAEVLETNTYGANAIKLRPFGLAEQVEKINRSAVRLAKEVAGDQAYVAGDVGPCSELGHPPKKEDLPKIEAAFSEQINLLADAGVDLILLETFSNLTELQLAAKIAKRTGLPVVASFSVSEEGYTAEGISAEDITDILNTDDHIDAIGLNCGTGPVGIYDALKKTLAHTSKPVVVMPNAGQPKTLGGRTLYLTNPEYFTEYCKKYIELGVRGIGGCCGTTPDHIREAARAIGTLSGVKQHIEIKPLQKPKQEVAVIATENKCEFARKLSEGKKVTSVEILPPRSGSLEPILEKCRKCERAGIDAINIPDGPRASARISPMIMALAILRETRIEPIPHYCCRDRNLIGMQSDLLGGYSAGLKNFLLITGDPPKLGNYPDATGVFDVDAIGLTQVVNNLNHGMDAGGNPIDPPTGIFIGVGANPVAVEMDREIDRFFAKIDAGAEYAITQPIFDPDALLRFLDSVEGYRGSIPIIAGLWPLLSFKNAEFMNNEVPGVVVPDSVLQRMAICQTKEDGRKMGIEIAREICAAVSDRVAGFQVSAPLGMVDIAMDVLAR